MPVEMFLKMDGVTSSSKNYNYREWSDVESWAWGMVSNRTAAQKAETDKTSFREIVITKPIAMDSPTIMLLYAEGTVIQNVELNVVPIVSKKEAKQKYIQIFMEKVLVKSIVTGGNSGEELFNEKIIFIFDKVKFEYFVNTPKTAENPKGTNVGYDFSWNIDNNTLVQ